MKINFIKKYINYFLAVNLKRENHRRFVSGKWESCGELGFKPVLGPADEDLDHFGDLFGHLAADNALAGQPGK